jgi:hypothetical protein
VFKAAQAHDGIKRFLDGVQVNKVIFVPNKLLNIVTQ